jgi:hypothetical protein
VERNESKKKPTAIVVMEDTAQAAGVVKLLADRNIAAEVETDPARAREHCRGAAPDLAVVGVPPGIPFLRELLKVSWLTNMILISDMDHEALHDEAEGLGILGAMKTPEDREGLDTLLERFYEIRARNV